ncbi:hypothetical protein ACJ6WF_16420 [Streptomyces sp. MMS24-I2-30]|uniref:hypothetical protein n=1 Tax=Streptomyces sp. MMS24-I2-30 TaxID=3351564 RepID=UPI003896D0F2
MTVTELASPPSRTSAVYSANAPTEANYDTALERMKQERDRLTEHIADLTRARNALDELMVINRAHRKALRAAR